jgi:hypothetical protein
VSRRSRRRERRRVRRLGRRWRRKVLVLLAASCVAAPVTWQLTAARRASTGCTARAGKASYRLDASQAAIATTIAATARRLKLPSSAVTVGLATAMQESSLRNLSHGDRDSVGVFQQRPSKGWGTRAQILSPGYAATAFFTALDKVPGWQKMAVTDAAQAVQRSGHPKAYAKWETQARVMTRAMAGELAAAFTCTVAKPRPAPFGQLTGALKAELGGKMLDTPVDAQRGWLIASWVVARANTYGVTQITVADQRWTAKSGAWKPSSPRTSSVRVVHR